VFDIKNVTILTIDHGLPQCLSSWPNLYKIGVASMAVPESEEDIRPHYNAYVECPKNSHSLLKVCLQWKSFNVFIKAHNQLEDLKSIYGDTSMKPITNKPVTLRTFVNGR
jgi:hypothetical protein